MTSARAHGLREAFVTMWGDDGMECDVFSALPALQYFAELGYGKLAPPKQYRTGYAQMQRTLARKDS